MASQINTISTSRTASWIGGIALLLIAVLAGVGYMGLIKPLVVSGDATATAQLIGAGETQFRVGVLFMLIAAVLDVVVAAALFVVFEPINRVAAQTAAWFRIAYSAVFLVAIAHLVSVPSLLGDPASALRAVESYTVIWQVGLSLFAVHLILVGYLGFRSGLLPKVLGILLVIAGLGYFADSVGTVLAPGFVATYASYTFVGEVALIGWLIVKAIRSPR